MVIWEVEDQVSHVPLGIDDEGGDTAQEGFLQDIHAEPGLAGARHSDDHTVGSQCVGLVDQGLSVGLASDVEGALVEFHGREGTKAERCSGIEDMLLLV